MRAIAIATVMLLMTGCGFPYEVAPADVATTDDSRDDTAIEDTTEVVDTGTADSDAEAATEVGTCSETGGSPSACTSCAVSQCPDIVMACNSDPVCNKWLSCARACACPNECLTKCAAGNMSETVTKSMQCLAMNCSKECF